MPKETPVGSKAVANYRSSPPGGTRTLHLTAAGLDVPKNLLKIGHFHVQSSARMGTGIAGRALEPSDAFVTHPDDPVVGVKLALHKGGLEDPAPHRAVESLEDLGRRCLDLPPHDLRHAASMPPCGPRLSPCARLDLSHTA